jgi:hypothetical protein
MVSQNASENFFTHIYATKKKVLVYGSLNAAVIGLFV